MFCLGGKKTWPNLFGSKKNARRRSYKSPSPPTTLFSAPLPFPFSERMRLVDPSLIPVPLCPAVRILQPVIWYKAMPSLLSDACSTPKISKVYVYIYIERRTTIGNVLFSSLQCHLSIYMRPRPYKTHSGPSHSPKAPTKAPTRSRFHPDENLTLSPPASFLPRRIDLCSAHLRSQNWYCTQSSAWSQARRQFSKDEKEAFSTSVRSCQVRSSR